jgi:tRNA dimethylallyltransferase
MSNLVFCLMGPTACGKTDLATKLFQHFPFELISVDSALIYRDMNIGTAKPSEEELRQTPHHLVNICNPTQTYSAAQFCTDAQILCAAIQQRQKIPLLVGGTMMYFNALQKGLSTLPKGDDVLRERLEREGNELGWPMLHQRLAKVDPQTAARIHAHDAQRIQRALEVYYLSGSSLTDLQSQKKATPRYRFVNLCLFPKNRSWLHKRIAQRFECMLDAGLINEVQELQKKWNLSAHLPSMRCVGYRQVLEYLNGAYGQNELREKAIAATRQLAKRQLTWLRHWDEGLRFDPEQAICTEMMAKITEILDNERF